MGDAADFIPTEGPLAQGVADRLPLLITHFGYEIAGRAEPRLAEIGLTGKTYMALAVLTSDHPRSQLELARLLGCVAAVVVAIADELEAAGFVERTRDPADRRRSLLGVTAAGRRALEQGDRIAAALEDELLGQIAPADRERLHAALRAALEPTAA